MWVEEKQRAIRLFWCEFQREQNTEKRASAGGAFRKIKRNTVRVWESEKWKKRHFSLFKLHARNINWWNSHGVFGCYNHGELEYLEEDFTIRFVVRLYLLLKIYLLYIQFIVNTSCNLYFIVDIFRSCPVIFSSTQEGFSHKMVFLCGCVYVVFAEFFVSIILLLLDSH